MLVVRGLQEGGDALVGTYNVTPTMIADVNSANQLDLEASALCMSSATTVTQPVRLDVAPRCVFSTTSTVLAHASVPTTAGSGDFFGFKKNIALPGALTNVAIETWARAAKATLTATNWPAETSLLNASSRSRAAHRSTASRATSMLSSERRSSTSSRASPTRSRRSSSSTRG